MLYLISFAIRSTGYNYIVPIPKGLNLRPSGRSPLITRYLYVWPTDGWLSTHGNPRSATALLGFVYARTTTAMCSILTPLIETLLFTDTARSGFIWTATTRPTSTHGQRRTDGCVCGKLNFAKSGRMFSECFCACIKAGRWLFSQTT